MTLTVQDQCLALLAEVPPKPALDWNVALAGSLLAAALLLGAWVIALAGKWRRASASGSDRLSSSAQLAHFRSLYDRGAISAEEFERLRNLLGEQMRRDLDIRAAPETPVKDTQNPQPDGRPVDKPAPPPPDGFPPT